MFDTPLDIQPATNETVFSFEIYSHTKKNIFWVSEAESYMQILVYKLLFTFTCFSIPMFPIFPYP